VVRVSVAAGALELKGRNRERARANLIETDAAEMHECVAPAAAEGEALLVYMLRFKCKKKRAASPRATRFQPTAPSRARRAEDSLGDNQNSWFGLAAAAGEKKCSWYPPATISCSGATSYGGRVRSP